MSKDFDFSQELSGLQVPTILVCADADMAHRATTSRPSSCSTVVSGWRLDG